MNFHKPVLLNEVIELLELKKNQNVIDCTVGGGGHAIEILKKTSPKGKLLGIDLDPLAIKHAEKALKKYSSRITLVCDNYKNINKIKRNVFNTIQIHAILCDLGLSSGQLKDNTRGFSYQASGDLDLRFGPGVGLLTARKIINTYKENELIKIFKEYGEEKLARPIAGAIIEKRRQQKIERPTELAQIIKSIYLRKFKTKSKIHPATKVFQALRIEVNQELENIKSFLPEAVKLLPKKGRLAVITFQGLEDKIIKEFIKRETRDCICPPKAPACVCNHQASIIKVTSKPVKPSSKEVRDNPRARSAKLWVVERV